MTSLIRKEGISETSLIKWIRHGKTPFTKQMAEVLIDAITSYDVAE